jgi:aconitate decarboxylase
LARKRKQQSKHRRNKKQRIMPSTESSEQPGPTARLSTWVAGLALEDIPGDIVTRAKYLVLDGIAAGLVGAHLPWSERAAKAIFELEPPGAATVIGWDYKLAPMSAALLNSSFIQGFELDDWRRDAPLHSNSIILPALFAAAQHTQQKIHSPASGADFLLATIAGFEVGPRIGLGLYGVHVLSTGWHSGAVFGPAAAAAAAVGKLLNLTPDQLEGAFGTACTQACGLMSAQFGSDVKRMQHGFAARNGLLAAVLAREGYTGIRGVFEQQYGGFLKQFSAGNGKDPQYRPEEVCKELGSLWRTEGISVKPYSAMAGTHSTVDCIRPLQELNPEKMQKTGNTKKIHIVMGEAAYKHGGWKAKRPLDTTGCQMSNAFVGATQLIHGYVLPAQFRSEMLNNDAVWKLVEVTECELSPHPDDPIGKQTVKIGFSDGQVLSHSVDAARGVKPPLSNDEIVEKFRMLTTDVIAAGLAAAAKIEKIVLELESLEDVSKLVELLLGGMTKNPIA